jgi:anti-anti-sigma factor
MNARPHLAMPPVGDFLSQPWESSHTTRLAHRRLRSSVAVVSARGHIDASNADTLTEYTLGHLTGCRGLIVDLRGLDFFGTEGFSALHRVSVCCAHPGIGWAVLPGDAVSRVLRIGDPQGLLPAASTVEAAIATFQGQPHRPPQPGSDITAAASCWPTTVRQATRVAAVPSDRSGWPLEWAT